MEDESEPKPKRDHILDWLEGSVLQFLPDDHPYHTNYVNMYPAQFHDHDPDSWWLDACQDLDQDLLISSSTTTSTPTSAASSTAVTSTSTALPTSSTPDLSKKRKSNQHHAQKKNFNNIDKESQDSIPKEPTAPYKKPVVAATASARRKTTKAAADGNSNSNNNKGSNSNSNRWAEQLLNPCASAITSWNPTRVQHLIYVLHELASPTGDANHRLAAHGLRALTQHLSSSPPNPNSTAPAPAPPSTSMFGIGSTLTPTFSSTEPQLFQKSIMRFDEVSPWFGFPNKIANSSILQILSDDQKTNNNKPRDLHILDIGVSHGVQWPTFLESLTRLPGGPPPLVRLTLLLDNYTNNHHHHHFDVDEGTNINKSHHMIPFALAPAGHNYSSRLLGFAKSMKINLHINQIQHHHQALHNLNAQLINSNPDQETFIVCAQFRLHSLDHTNPDSRTEFLKLLKSLNPKGLILNEYNMDCSCTNCGDFAVGFSRKVEYLWRFLDSTSAAFKGRETEERRVMEGEAAKALTSLDQMNQGKDQWCERTTSAGFVGKPFSEDTIDEARALLRKYDSNWEMKVDERDGCVGLWWKGQPVSFCSLWT